MEKFWKNLKRILKNYIKTLKYIRNKTSYLYTFLFFDTIWCYVRYGITYNEYRIFEYYNVSYDKRKTYISKRKYKKLLKKLVPMDIINVIEDKKLFKSRLKDYIKNNIYDINEMSFKEFEDFALNSKKILARSENKRLINSLKNYDISKYRSPAFALEDIKNNKLYMVEKSISQHKLLNEINDLVLINVVSVVNNKNVDAVTSSIKFKDNDHIITGCVNVQTGKIVGHFKDENGHNYGEMFEGFEIPNYDDIMDLTLKLALELEEINQIEWTFAVGNRGSIYLLDAGVWDDYVFSQIPEFLKDNTGLMSYYKKYL